MRTRWSAILGMLVLGGVAACDRRTAADLSKANAEELAAREQRLSQRLAAVDAGANADSAVAKWIMPAELSEISGIALTQDGRLLAHGDEIGRIYEIDPRRGVVLSHFNLGGAAGRGDFEAITVAGNSIYIASSNGDLFEFQEGAPGASVPVRRHDTRLGKECEFEGAAFEPDSSWILLPCKNVHTKGARDQLVIYKWSTTAGSQQSPAMLTIPLAQVIANNGWKSLHVSDMTIDPGTGNYVLISAQENALVELTPGGRVVRSGPLPGGKHQQAEGVAITRDNVLMISDEAAKGPAAITLYRWSPDGSSRASSDAPSQANAGDSLQPMTRGDSSR